MQFTFYRSNGFGKGKTFDGRLIMEKPWTLLQINMQGKAILSFTLQCLN